MTQLTLAACRDLLPYETIKDHVITGLHLRAGKVSKSWMLHYRTKTKIVRRPKLGDFPALGIEAAREAARKLLARVAVGEDPANEWEVDRKAATVAQLCDKYLPWCKTRKKTWAAEARMIERFVRPSPFGDRLVKDVELEHVEALLTDIRDRHPRFKTKGRNRHEDREQLPVMANRVRSVLHTMFKQARLHWKMREGENPVNDAFRHKERSRKRYATPNELKALAVAVGKLERTHPRQAAAVWTLFFTGGRVNEVAKARTSQLIGRKLVLTEHKTMDTNDADRVIHIPDAAWAILQRLPAAKDGYLFGGARLNFIWGKLRKEAGCPDLQLRDARRTFASVGLSNGLSLDQVGGLLGHQSAQTTKGYAYLMTDAAARAANATGGHVAALMELPPQALLPAPALPRARPEPRLRPKLRARDLF